MRRVALWLLLLLVPLAARCQEASEPNRVEPVVESLAALADASGGAAQLDELAEKTALFKSDALDMGAFTTMDCHMRNLDLCYAGMLATAQRALPETDAELEVRCDEAKAAGVCLAKFNERCQSFKAFALMAPFAQQQQQQQELAAKLELPPALEEQLVGSGQQEPLKVADLMGVCEPNQKQTRANKLIRARLFQLAKCVNARLPALRPCIEDLKAALQLFYEPRRVLPLKPSCCALARFRHCATQALDNLCGLSSFEQLEKSLSGVGGAGESLKLVGRVCRQGARHDSQFCAELLPPSGMRVQPKRGSKASKLARALDLISFAPAAQTS